MSREQFVTAELISKEFGIKESLAQEIINEETQRALRRSAFAWVVLLVGVGLSGWLYLQPDTEKLTSVMVLIFSVISWRVVGLYKAEAAVRKAALAERDAIDQRKS